LDVSSVAFLLSHATRANTIKQSAIIIAIIFFILSSFLLFGYHKGTVFYFCEVIITYRVLQRCYKFGGESKFFKNFLKRCRNFLHLFNYKSNIYCKAPIYEGKTGIYQSAFINFGKVIGKSK
jgi:hypothetical protein